MIYVCISWNMTCTVYSVYSIDPQIWHAYIVVPPHCFSIVFRSQKLQEIPPCRRLFLGTASTLGAEPEPRPEFQPPDRGGAGGAGQVELIWVPQMAELCGPHWQDVRPNYSGYWNITFYPGWWEDYGNESMKVPLLLEARGKIVDKLDKLPLSCIGLYNP